MFVGTCGGCIPIPTTIYCWNPYPVKAFDKKSSFLITDIMGEAQTFKIPQKNSQNLQQQLYEQQERPEFSYRRRHEQKYAKTARVCNERPYIKEGLPINYSKRDGATCTLPSALEPLQALCSVGPRGYTVSRVETNADRHVKASTNSKSDLKFGISKILSEDFGKEKTDKENAQKEQDHSFISHRKTCECTWNCSIYQRHTRYPNHVLSAVHALQPPKYSTSPTGSDVLPGPYSILNTDVNVDNQTKRKRSWSRAVFSNLQRKGLEKRFEVQKYVTKPDRRQLAALLGLTDAQVKVWFQNRRMKWRHVQQQQQSTETGVSTPETAEKTELSSDCSRVCTNIVKNGDAKAMDTDSEFSDTEEIVVTATDINENTSQNSTLSDN